MKPTLNYAYTSVSVIQHLKSPTVLLKIPIYDIMYVWPTYRNPEKI